MTTKFEIGKEYAVNFKNGNPAGTMVIKSFDRFVDMSFGVNKCFHGFAELNGKKVKIAIVGDDGGVIHFVNNANRYNFVMA